MKIPVSTMIELHSGDRVGRWTLITALPCEARRSARARPRWHCKCECGVEKQVLAQSLRLALSSSFGGSRSCGCFAKDCSTRHGSASGKKPTGEYLAWSAAKKRCGNPGNASFRSYGARGIRVCADWAFSFEAFLRDMGPRPSPVHSLDRIDPSGDYEPSNCRWALPEVQVRNRRCVRWYAFEGDRLLLAELAARLGITRDQARSLERLGRLPAWWIQGATWIAADAIAGPLIDLNEAPARSGTAEDSAGAALTHRGAATA
jgi:hypothetical protein